MTTRASFNQCLGGHYLQITLMQALQEAQPMLCFVLPFYHNAIHRNYLAFLGLKCFVNLSFCRKFMTTLASKNFGNMYSDQ